MREPRTTQSSIEADSASPDQVLELALPSGELRTDIVVPDASSISPATSEIESWAAFSFGEMPTRITANNRELDPGDAQAAVFYEATVMVPNRWGDIYCSEDPEEQQALAADTKTARLHEFVQRHLLPVFAGGFGLAFGAVALSEGLVGVVHGLIETGSLIAGATEPLLAAGIALTCGITAAALWRSDFCKLPIGSPELYFKIGEGIGFKTPSIDNPSLNDALRKIGESNTLKERTQAAYDAVEMLGDVRSLEDRVAIGYALLGVMATSGLHLTTIYDASYIAHFSDLTKWLQSSTEAEAMAKLSVLSRSGILGLPQPNMDIDLNYEWFQSRGEDLYGIIKAHCSAWPSVTALLALEVYRVTPPAAVLRDDLEACIVECMRVIDPEYKDIIASRFVRAGLKLDKHMQELVSGSNTERK